MKIKTENKHELRTRETHALLLAAAETIFARDGYEGAELGEIAALAGRTKGAIYAQFKSKEDIFLALIEDRTRVYRAKMEKLLAQSTNVEGNIAAVRGFFVERADDHTWALLMLEFKLFAMRHHNSKKRFQKIYAGIFPPNSESRFAEVLGAAETGTNAISRVVAIQALQPIISGLILEAQMGTSLSEGGVIKKLTNQIFDVLLQAPKR
jgi:AcrR family transcriptional regulator